MGLAGYLVLLGVWPLYIAPAWRGGGGARRWCLGAAGLGGLAAAREAWMTFVWGPGAIGPIRIDIPLVCALLTLVYLLAAARCWRAGWARTALAAGLLAAAGGGSVALAWEQATREGERLGRLFDAGNRLLFEAKFRDAPTYEAHFGMTGAPSAAPAGHWLAGPGANISRLVVNPAGRAFLFHRCSGTECQFGPGARLERVAAEPELPWSARLVWRGVGERVLRLGEPDGDQLLAEVDGRRTVLRRTPPPLGDGPVEEQLRDLGAYTATEYLRQHVRVTQLWLWQGEGALWAVGLFEVLVPGRRADFATPVRMGRGRREGDRWRFAWEARGERWEALVRVADGAVEIALPGREDRWPAQRLAPGALFRDEVMELAPRTSAADWERWFDTLLVGHFSSAAIPARSREGSERGADGEGQRPRPYAPASKSARAAG